MYKCVFYFGGINHYVNFITILRRMGNIQSNGSEGINKKALNNHTIVIRLHTLSAGDIIDNGTITCPFLTTVEDLKIGIEKLLKISTKEQVLGNKTKAFRIERDMLVHSLLESQFSGKHCASDKCLVIYTKGQMPSDVCICETFRENPPLVRCPVCVTSNNINNK